MLQRLRHRANGQEGFTLIELLVVILIIGILAAVAIPAFLNQRGKAQDASVKSDARSAATAEETYYTDNQTYTATSTDLTAIEPTLAQAFVAFSSGGDGMTITAASGTGNTIANSYDIHVESKSTVTYDYIRSADGTVTRSCTVPSGVNAGGCKNGSW